MNKYLLLIILAVVLVIGGIVYKTQFVSKSVAPSGNTVTVEMHARENSWTWDPDTIRVKAGDHVVLNITNEDTYDHGFAVDAFGINKRISPKSSIQLEFDATRTGEFIFYCSVPCGSGTVNGKIRGHPDQTGKIIIEK